MNCKFDLLLKAATTLIVLFLKSNKKQFPEEPGGM